LLSLKIEADINQMASLEATLKRAIQTEFQLEDSEIASEPLPDRKNRRHLLFYEASEGGAGVLRQLVEDPSSWGRVARTALYLSHFDPETGEDLGKAEHAEETCQAACYDCLLSYYNQPDHPLLDRHLIRDLLISLRDTSVIASPVEKPRAQHLEELKRLCDSGLERDFLDFLEAHALRLPTRAQHLYEKYKTRPDFSYTGDNPAIVYVDGPPHDYPHRQERDKEQTAALQAQGFTVVRFHHRDNWMEISSKHPSIFGEPK
jgi:very-short-patch-repair endonuclease